MKVDYGFATGRHWLSIDGKEIYQGSGADVPLADEDVVRLVRALFPDCTWAAPSQEGVGQGDAASAAPIVVRFNPEIRSDGELVRVTITQGEKELKLTNEQAVSLVQELSRRFPNVLALHASAPVGQKCADCTMDGEPCPDCYEAWWQKRHPNTIRVGAAPKAAGQVTAESASAVDRGQHEPAPAAPAWAEEIQALYTLAGGPVHRQKLIVALVNRWPDIYRALSRPGACVSLPVEIFDGALNYIRHLTRATAIGDQPHPQQWIVDGLLAASKETKP